ncbi:hypothetical protein PR048_002636 [Dryococelus australis]|uniref:Uncharacterized protein n=1 Tax=Dryococelus australis TaxID=614101 RepID=A0ABQ9IKP7_9NEOP|nr:hypothetical protein PR048_002636 [Dryococelus australis]
MTPYVGEDVDVDGMNNSLPISGRSCSYCGETSSRSCNACRHEKTYHNHVEQYTPPARKHVRVLGKLNDNGFLLKESASRSSLETSAQFQSMPISAVPDIYKWFSCAYKSSGTRRSRRIPFWSLLRPKYAQMTCSSIFNTGDSNKIVSEKTWEALKCEILRADEDEVAPGGCPTRELEKILVDGLPHYIYTAVVQRSAVFGKGHLAECARAKLSMDDGRRLWDDGGRGFCGVNGRERIKSDEEFFPECVPLQGVYLRALKDEQPRGRANWLIERGGGRPPFVEIATRPDLLNNECGETRTFRGALWRHPLPVVRARRGNHMVIRSLASASPQTRPPPPSPRGDGPWGVCDRPVLCQSPRARRNERAGKRGIPEKTYGPSVLSGTIPTCKNLGMTPPASQLGSPRWEVNSLTTTPSPPLRRMRLGEGPRKDNKEKGLTNTRTRVRLARQPVNQRRRKTSSPLVARRLQLPVVRSPVHSSRATPSLASSLNSDWLRCIENIIPCLPPERRSTRETNLLLLVSKTSGESVERIASGNVSTTRKPGSCRQRLPHPKMSDLIRQGSNQNHCGGRPA